MSKFKDKERYLQMKIFNRINCMKSNRVTKLKVGIVVSVVILIMLAGHTICTHNSTTREKEAYEYEVVYSKTYDACRQNIEIELEDEDADLEASEENEDVKVFEEFINNDDTENIETESVEDSEDDSEITELVEEKIDSADSDVIAEAEEDETVAEISEVKTEKTNTESPLLSKRQVVITDTEPVEIGMSVASSYSLKSSTNFIKVRGTKLYDQYGTEFVIKAMGFGNNVWANPSKPVYTYNDENSYKELAELGFNTVKYYLNYRLFEDDAKPYTYKEEGFAWLDQNVEWASKYGIKIMFNMHVPQGGFLSASSANLWNESNVRRYQQLWVTLAKRYANNDNVIGYGLLNEPYMSKYSNDGSTELNMYYYVINSTISKIRAVDNNHILFVERPYGVVKNYNATYPWTTEQSMKLVNDSNTVYEFHYYTPIDFTHYGLSWLSYNREITYNDTNKVLLMDDRKDIEFKYNKLAYSNVSSGWHSYNSGPIKFTNKNVNFGYWQLYVAGLGNNGQLYVDNIVIEKYDAKGNKTGTIYTQDFTKYPSLNAWDMGTGGGKWAFAAGKSSNNACVGIGGVKGYYKLLEQNSFYRNIKIDTDSYYVVKADYKFVNAPSTNCGFAIGIQGAYTSKLYTFDKEYLERDMLQFINFGEKYNVPVFLGELGTTTYTIDKEHKGDEWVADMLDICKKYDIGFSYHDYHDQNFGFYMNDMYVKQGDRNELLYKVFKEKLK
ncbi:MAG: cellulase family glycosylhydrolase [Lachnospiraceae bacterium]|nr:cellulase family glycosylhydrolase [Lachnospiraceae bacterium]